MATTKENPGLEHLGFSSEVIKKMTPAVRELKLTDLRSLSSAMMMVAAEDGDTINIKCCCCCCCVISKAEE